MEMGFEKECGLGRRLVSPCPGNGFFATFAGNGGKSSDGYPYIFGVNIFSCGTSDVIAHRCVLEIQMAATPGSTNISETMIYTISFPTANLRFSTIAKSQEVYQGVSKYDRLLKMAAETGSTYISENRTCTVKIPTTNLRFKTL